MFANPHYRVFEFSIVWLVKLVHIKGRGQCFESLHVHGNNTGKAILVHREDRGTVFLTFKQIHVVNYVEQNPMHKYGCQMFMDSIMLTLRMPELEGIAQQFCTS